MDKKDNELREQEAPGKNTDHAFVRVGEDGHPVMPNAEEAAHTNSSNKEQDAPEEGTLKHR
jgi:hypothetical protein